MFYVKASKLAEARDSKIFLLLQVGLAVGDIDQMKKFATVRRLAMQIEYQIEIEEAYPSFIINRGYQEVYVEKPNKYSRRNRYGRKTF